MLSIKVRQKYLKNLGFYKGEIDGKEGTLTKQAYRKLQTKYFVRKKDVDSRYGDDTEILLRNAERVRLYTKNFKLEEFSCECKGKYCTGYPELLDIDLLKDIQKIRDLYGSTTITSGLRCTKHNSLVGGVPYSKHKLGKAIDFVNSGTSNFEKRKALIDKYIKWHKSSYSYCNGYARQRSGLKYYTSYPDWPSMANAVHIDKK